MAPQLVALAPQLAEQANCGGGGTGGRGEGGGGGAVPELAQLEALLRKDPFSDMDRSVPVVSSMGDLGM